MAGPWEKYAAQSPQAAAGPWTKYATRQAPQQQGAPIQSVTQMTNPKLNIAASGENMPEYVGATGAAGAGLMGGAALGETPLVGPALKWAGRKLAPYALPAAGSYLINQARQLPVVGPVIKHIPFAEMLPWLVSGGSKGKAAEEEEAAAAKTPRKVSPPPVTGFKGPYEPEPAPAPRQVSPPPLRGFKAPYEPEPAPVPRKVSPPPVTGFKGPYKPEEVERPMPEIPPSRVSTTPPKGTPMTKADVLARVRAIAQQPGTGVVTREPSGPQTLIEGKPVAAGADLTEALQKSLPQNRIEGKIMQVVRREGTLGMDRLMQAPELQGLSRQEVEAAATELGNSKKLWVPTKEADAHGPAGIISLAIRKK